MRVGFLSLWFERGQAHVTRTLRSALLPYAEVFVLARTATLFGEARLETTGPWAVPNLTTWPQFAVPAAALGEWVRNHALDVVVFNEEHDWSLLDAVRSAGARPVTYLDFYADSWRNELVRYDAVLCSTRRSFDLVRDHCPAHHVGFATDLDTFCPTPVDDKRYTFFHNAGWLGIGYRKMTPAAVLAFDAVSRTLPDVTLLVHAQIGSGHLPPAARAAVECNDRLDWVTRTVPAPGLYHLGRILLFPSKLEGLGLPLLEGLAAGMPVVATDAPPMNQFVRPGVNGDLVAVARRRVREDGIAFPEAIVDVGDLALKMAALALDPERAARLSAGARIFAEQHFRLDELGARVSDVLRRLA